MKKFTYTLAIFSISCAFFACSKKVHTFNFGKPYHESAPLASQGQENEEEIAFSAPISASTSDAMVEAAPSQSLDIKKLSNPVVVPAVEAPSVEKQTFKQKLATKIITKKIEKIQKGGISDKMKLGIVIAAVSLVVLIVVAAGLLGGLSTLFWLLGGLGFLAGLLIILLAALDVI